MLQYRYPTRYALGTRCRDHGRPVASRPAIRLGAALAGTRSCASTPTGSTGWPTGCPATAPTPRTSPRRPSSGCSGRWPTTRPARSRAGCTASPPTCSWTWSGAGSGSGSTRCPRTPATGWPRASPAPSRPTSRCNLDPEIQRALDALPADFRVAVVLCDLEELSYEEIAADPRHQGRHGPLPHPPWPGAAARGAGAPRARTPSAGRIRRGLLRHA